MTPEEIAAEAAANDTAPEGEPDTTPDVEPDAEVEPDADPDAGAVALTEALESIQGLASQVAELTADKVRLQAVNYRLLEQISAGDTEPPDPADDEPVADDNPESVDDALAAHEIKE